MVIAVEEKGSGIGRIRFRQIPNRSAPTLNRFLLESVTPGSVIRTDGWKGYRKVGSIGFEHEATVLKGRKEEVSERLPRVHLVISLLKRWLMGTHQGAVSHKHLDYYLDEFTFRFNRRKSMNRGSYSTDQFSRLWLSSLFLWTRFCIPKRSKIVSCRHGKLRQGKQIPISRLFKRQAHSFPCRYLDQAMASIPRMDARVSSFAAGPLGIFSPRSHLLTTPTVTFKWAAKTA